MASEKDFWSQDGYSSANEFYNARGTLGGSVSDTDKERAIAITGSTFDLWWPEQAFQPPKNYKELSAIAVCFAQSAYDAGRKAGIEEAAKRTKDNIDKQDNSGAWDKGWNAASRHLSVEIRKLGEKP